MGIDSILFECAVGCIWSESEDDGGGATDGLGALRELQTQGSPGLKDPQMDSLSGLREMQREDLDRTMSRLRAL